MVLFFIFARFTFFRLLRWSKGKKCPSCLMSQEPYIIQSVFMVHICKRIISRCSSTFFFQIFIFGVNSGVKGQKNGSKWRKKLSVVLLSGSIHHMIVIFGTHVKVMTSPDALIKILIFRVVRGRGKGKAKNCPKWQKIRFLTPYIRNYTSYNCGFWYTYVKWWYL